MVWFQNSFVVLVLFSFSLKVKANDTCDNLKENCLNEPLTSVVKSLYRNTDSNNTNDNSSINWRLLSMNHSLSYEVKNNLSDAPNYLFSLDELKPNGDYWKINENHIEANPHEEDLITILSKKTLDVIAPFNPAYSDRASAKCREQSAIYMDALNKFQIWALRMHDSSAKFTSGVLNGNINQYGDFDQCLKVKRKTSDGIHGQYCLAGVQVSIPQNTRLLQHLYNMVHSNGLLKSQLDDPGHRVPRYSTINWALCVPSGCTHTDIELSLKEFLLNYTQGTGMHMQVRVENELCQTKDAVWKKNLDQTTINVWCIFAAFLLITLASTLYDFKVDEHKNEWLTTFSLIKNTKEIVSLKEDPNDVKCLHGIRFINAMLLLIAHKTMAEFFNPFINRTQMSEVLGQPWTVVGRAAAIFTDPFIMFSGFLTTYSLIGRLQRGQNIKLYQDYIGRILRIAPPLGALILFCSFILPYLGSGPQWNLVVTNHGDICRKYWWRNLLFIHNYFGFKDMCLTHTHHIGIDTELFFVSPIFILTLWKWPKKGSILIVSLAVFTTLHRFYTTYKLRLANYVYFGTSVQQLFDTADLMYILPYYRATVYFMGILLGYACRVYKDIKLTKNQLKIGWYGSTILFLLAFFGPAHMGSINYVYNPLHAASYAAFSPIAWCIFFAWAVFTSHIGYPNKLTNMLSWRGFRVTTRLSYAIYLTQFPVFFYNVGQVRNPQHFNFLRRNIFNTNEYLCVFIVSYFLTVFCETPFSNIKKLLFRSSSKIEKKLSDLSENSKTIIYEKNMIKELKD